MRIIITRILALSFVSISTAKAAPPPNDNILKAVILAGNCSAYGTEHDLSAATPAATDPMINNQSAGKTLWFCFPAPVVFGVLRCEIKTSTATGTVRCYRFMDPDNPAGTLVSAANAISFSGNQEFTAHVSQPQGGLMVMVSGTGKFQIRHRFASTDTPNDFPADAIDLTGERGTVTGDNTMATTSSDEPQLPAFAPTCANTVWYKWTPGFSGTAYVDTNFSYLSGQPMTSPDGGPVGMHVTVVSVFHGPLNALVYDAHDYYGGFGSNSRVSFVAVAGTTYTIGVSTNGGNAPGNYILNYYRGNSGGEISVITPQGSSSQYLAEGTGSVKAIVRRRYAADVTAFCALATADHTAKATLDYNGFNTTATFANDQSDQQWQREYSVTILQDAVYEGTEYFRFTASNPSANATLGTLSSAYFYIEDDDQQPTTSLVGPPDDLYVSENESRLWVPIRRNSNTTTEEELNQYKIGGTAELVHDFTLYPGAVLHANESESKVAFDVTNDNVFEADETVMVAVTGGASYRVTIQDDDLYIPTQGRLTTALTYADNARKGVFFATVSAVGVVTGKFIAVGKTVPVTGRLDTRGKLVVPLILPGRAACFYLTLEAQDNKGAFKITLLDGATSKLDTARGVMQSFSPVVNPCPLAGTYTVYGPGDANVECSTAASTKVDASGNVVMAGKIYDGTPYTASGYVDKDGYAGVLAALYAGKGCVALDGLLPVNLNQTTGVEMTVNRPARTGSQAVAPPFVMSSVGIATRYTPPAKNSYALPVWNMGTGRATLTGMSLANMITKNLAISSSNVITAPADAEQLKLKVTPATGVFTGSIIIPGTVKPVPVFGVLSQAGMSSLGKGWFFNGYYGGGVRLTGT